jgi:hypothetical protein
VGTREAGRKERKLPGGGSEESDPGRPRIMCDQKQAFISSYYIWWVLVRYKLHKEKPMLFLLVFFFFLSNLHDPSSLF